MRNCDKGRTLGRPRSTTLEQLSLCRPQPFVLGPRRPRSLTRPHRGSFPCFSVQCSKDRRIFTNFGFPLFILANTGRSSGTGKQCRICFLENGLSQPLSHGLRCAVHLRLAWCHPVNTCGKAGCPLVCCRLKLPFLSYF